MYKKAILLAVLVLAASAASNDMEARKKLYSKAKAHFKARHAKREPDSCSVVKCGMAGEECDDKTTYCINPTDCNEGICRKSLAGEYCGDGVECYNESLYCKSGVCNEYKKEGDPCTSLCLTKEGEILVCDSATSTCKAKKANPWEPCEYGTVCQGGSFCTASYPGDDGVCAIIPVTVGTECNASYGCDLSKYLYCNSESSKCAELPKEGDECAEYYYCNEGFYCSNSGRICRAKKDLGEECSEYNECKSGLKCSNDNKCRSSDPKEGEYCDNEIRCDYDKKCTNNVCVKKDGTCEIDDDCPGTLVFCDDGKCKGDMGIAEGGKCIIESLYKDDSLIASLQCQEGLGCVPIARGEEEGTCKKITASAGKECASDEDCPLDAFCDCNDKEGKMQCIPVPTSTKDAFEKTVKFYNSEDTCKNKNLKTEEEYDKCLINEEMGYYELAHSLFDYDSEYRCVDLSILGGGASSVKISMVAMAATLLFALFFF